MRYIIASLLLLVMVTGNSFAGSLKDEYELKKKCSQEASEYFSDFGGTVQRGDGFRTYSNYKNHYNKKMNSCIILTSSTTVYDDKQIANLIMSDLLDLQENNIIGEFMYMEHKEIVCVVGGVKCNSKQEFDRLVKPYMTQ